MSLFDPYFAIKRFIADAGYESEENYSYLAGKGIDCYIKPQTYEQQKKRGFKKQITMADEVEAWARLQTICAEGSKEREEIDNQWFEASRRLFEQQQKLTQEMEDAEADYTKAVENRTQAIVGTFGLFDELKEKEDISKDTLVKNLKDQVKELENWSSNLEKLSKKGIDEGLLAELEKMGPSANAQIAALSSMSEKELSNYAELWRKKTAIAREQAVGELQGLREDTFKEIELIKDKLEQISTVTLPPVEVQSPFTEAASVAASMIGSIAQKAAAEIAPFTEAGKAQINGVIDGYKQTEPQVVEAARDISTKADAEISSWQPKYIPKLPKT